MGNPTILIGIGLVMFGLIYMFFRLGDKAEDGNNHFPLQLLMLFLILSCFTLIGKVTLDDQDFCSWNVINSTTNGATTTYGYDYQCETNPNSTADIFYKTSLWIFRLVSAYVIIYLMYYVLRWINDIVRGKSD
jgi:hypothetical protein